VDPTSSPKKKRQSREDSIASKFSRIKSSFFGQSPEQQSFLPHQQQQPVIVSAGSQQHQRRRNPQEYRPVRYDLPTEDSSEPSQYFRDHGHPWTAYRAPTPLPPFGTDEYYQVIKSSNPSPTTSNESELGSTPEDISSREDLFLPGPPDLPESPYPRRSNVNTADRDTAVNESLVDHPHPSSDSKGIIPSTDSSFVPIKADNAIAGTSRSSQRSKKSSFKGRTVLSSGEEAVGHSSRRALTRSNMNQSDPVLSTSSSRVDGAPPSQFANIIEATSSSQIPVTNSRTEHVPLLQSNGVDQSRGGGGELSSPPRIGSPPLTRQSAITADPHNSRENTPQQ
jgi:hypothetical protein